MNQISKTLEFIEKHQDKVNWQLISKYQKLSESFITKFKDKVFTEEQKQLIPNLGEEFELPEQLKPICNAVVNGDSKTVLLHGPAGTGKTQTGGF